MVNQASVWKTAPKISPTTVLIQFRFGDIDEDFPWISDNTLSFHSRIRSKVFLSYRCQFPYHPGKGRFNIRHVQAPGGLNLNSSSTILYKMLGG